MSEVAHKEFGFDSGLGRSVEGPNTLNVSATRPAFGLARCSGWGGAWRGGGGGGGQGGGGGGVRGWVV